MPFPRKSGKPSWLPTQSHRHKLFRRVFGGRYKAQLVEASGNGYLRTACDYVHLNPLRVRVLKPEERLLAYPSSSFGD